MTKVLLVAASRRRLLGATGLLGAGARTVGAAADPDVGLLTAAAAFCVLERRMRELIEGPNSVLDDNARELLLKPLRDQQASYVDLLCRQHARSLAGHRARAAAFALWDDGELNDLANANGFPADRLLAAMVRDLTRTTE